MLRAIAVVAVVAAGGLGLACAGSGAAAVPHPESAVAVVESSGCQAVSERATGWFGPGGLVITVAHAVRGSTAVAVDGAATRVVALDVRADVAALAVDASRRRLDLAPGPGGGAGGAAWVAHVIDGRPSSAATTASGGLVINIDEPADDTVYTRAGLSLTFGAARGDSGSPVVDRAGRVIGMIFAAARTDANLSYAVGATEIAAVLTGLTPESPSIPTGRCA
ncbi:MAG TPA: trypsin-like peptidase domain-containing protein [Acidimicrobiales bacterium]|nr:trypsin-like peptidase domain-containing protein [Acidimicrobiales bacterium]